MAFDTDRVKKIIEDGLAQFAKEYPIGYIKALVKQIRDETEGEEHSHKHLLIRPPEPEIRKQGWIVKKGAFIKNWKKRWFMVDKEYRVHYFVNEKDLEVKDAKGNFKKMKGQFSCYGYRVKKDEDKEAKPFTLKIQPWWDDDYCKRTWYCVLNDEQEYDSWKKMFQDCCWNSPNPMHPNTVRRHAFEHAYKKMENYWYFWATGTEEDMLAYVIFRRCEREVLGEAYSKLPGGSLGWKARDKIRSTVAGMISPPVQAAWKAAGTAIDNIEKPTTEKVRQAVGPIFGAIKAMKDKIQAKFEEKVIPIISALMAPIAEKLMPKVSNPLIKAQKDLIEEFLKHVDDGSRGSWYLYWELRKRESEWDIVMDVARAILDNWELTYLPSKIMDSCFDLLESARYNYKEVDAKDKAVTSAKLLHDCLQEMHKILSWLVETIVLKPFNEKFGEVIDELCSPIEELIPDAIKEFLSPSDIIKEMAGNAMKSALQAVITAGDQSTVPAQLVGHFQQQGVTVDLSKVHKGEHKSGEQKEEVVVVKETVVVKDTVVVNSSTGEATETTTVVATESTTTAVVAA